MEAAGGCAGPEVTVGHSSPGTSQTHGFSSTFHAHPGLCQVHPRWRTRTNQGFSPRGARMDLGRSQSRMVMECWTWGQAVRTLQSEAWLQRRGSGGRLGCSLGGPDRKGRRSSSRGVTPPGSPAGEASQGDRRGHGNSSGHLSEACAAMLPLLRFLTPKWGATAVLTSQGSWETYTS